MAIAVQLSGTYIYIYIIMYVLHIFECVNEYIQYMLLNNECIWLEGYIIYMYIKIRDDYASM